MNDKNQTSSNCDMHEALVSYLYDEASAEESRQVESHLKQCNACKQELAAFQGLRGVLQQWELDEMPVVRVNPPIARKSVLGTLKELLTVTPVWAKALGTAAAVMVILAATGTEVTVGRAGLTVRMSFLGLGRQQVASVAPPAARPPANVVQAALTEDQVKQIVNQAIVQREQQQRNELHEDLVRMEAQLRTTLRSSDLQKITLRVEKQRDRILALERDIDRREGLDLTDILYSGRRGQSDGTGGGQ